MANVYYEVEMIVIESMNYLGLTVSNLENSIKFYEELFDFEVIDKLSTSGEAIMKMGDIRIALNEVEDFKNQLNSKRCLSLFIDEQDFDDAIEELEEADIKIVHGPENIRNGQSVVFLDPDDNKIELSYPRID